MLISSDQGYGYDSYYLGRKNEELNFPSNATIASYFGATNYEVKNVSFPLKMNVKGTLVAFSETENGYLSGVAKHIKVIDQVIPGVKPDEEDDLLVEYNFGKIVVDGNLDKIVRGTIYVGETAVQTFTVDRDSREVLFNDIGTPAKYCTSGTFKSDDESASSELESYLSFTWNTDPVIPAPTPTATPGPTATPTPEVLLTSSVVVDYEYLSSKITSVSSETIPIADEYNNVSVYGLTSIETKYIKIMTNFKCKITLMDSLGQRRVGYTYVESRTFYTRCKRGNILCSSYSNAIVPAITVCNQRLF